MSSVQEYETASSFISKKYAAPLCNALHKMGHIQGPKTIQFDYIVANITITDTVVQCRSKAMDIKFYLLCSWFQQKQFHVNWNQGKHNLAKNPSKHHSTQHHISVRPTYVINIIKKQNKYLFKWLKIPTTLQGFVQTYLTPTIEQPLDYKYSIPPVYVASAFNQQHHLTHQPFNLSKNRPSNHDYFNQRRHLNVNLESFPKQTNMLLESGQTFK